MEEWAALGISECTASSAGVAKTVDTISISSPTVQSSGCAVSSLMTTLLHSSSGLIDTTTGRPPKPKKFSTQVLARRVKPELIGSPINRKRWLKDRVWSRLPVLWRPFAYFVYRYFLCLGFLDGREGLIFHVLQGFWFRFLVDSKAYERTRVPVR